MERWLERGRKKVGYSSMTMEHVDITQHSPVMFNPSLLVCFSHTHSDILAYA